MGHFAEPPLVAGIRYCWAVSRRLSTMLVGVVVATSLALLVATIATGAVVGGVEEGRFPTTALIIASLGWTLPMSLAPIAAAVQARLERELEGDVWRRVMEVAVEPAGIAHLEDVNFVNETRLAEGVTWAARPSRILSSVRQVLMARLNAVWSIVILVQFRWWAPVVLVGVMIVQYRWFNKETDHLWTSFFGGTEGLRRAQYFSELGTRPAAAKDLRVFGLASWTSSLMSTNWNAAMEEVWRNRRKLNGPMLLTTAILAVAYGAVMFTLGRAAIDGTVSLEQLVIFAQTTLGFANLGSQGQADVALRSATNSITHLRKLPKHPSVLLATLGGARRDASGSPRNDIRFEGVRFAYPASDVCVYEKLDLRIEAGASLAVVGANGAGKTTLVKLLARLYDPDGGRIVVDGSDLRDLDPDGWRQRVSVIFQDFARYELSARENVSFDAPMSELRRAAEQAGALDLIESLPNGWDTILSRGYPGGVDLSGGQWQRIALTRALVSARDGGLLILDEPTAHLDVRAEAELFDRFLELTRGLTTILVSHRFSSVRHASRIVVLDKGRVVEDGSHEDLIAAGGAYAKMFSLQADRFRESPADARPGVRRA